MYSDPINAKISSDYFNDQSQGVESEPLNWLKLTKNDLNEKDNWDDLNKLIMTKNVLKWPDLT